MLIGFVALLPVGPEFAGAATNRRTAKDANIAKRFDPWVYPSHGPRVVSSASATR